MSMNLYVTLYDKKDFVDMIKLIILRWKDYPRLSGCVQCTHNDFYRRDIVKSDKQGDVMTEIGVM